jgi:hypothetical protein
MIATDGFTPSSSQSKICLGAVAWVGKPVRSAAPQNPKWYDFCAFVVAKSLF